VKGEPDGPSRYDIQYQTVAPTQITQMATSMPSVPSAKRARVSRRSSSCSRELRSPEGSSCFVSSSMLAFRTGS
jgi:hypothetical protein